jgi:hypothetical protein
MRLKPDGTLDLDWREVRKPWWMKAPEERRALLLEVIRRNNPELTPEEAQELLDSFF